MRIRSSTYENTPVNDTVEDDHDDKVRRLVKWGLPPCRKAYAKDVNLTVEHVKAPNGLYSMILVSIKFSVNVLSSWIWFKLVFHLIIIWCWSEDNYEVPDYYDDDYFAFLDYYEEYCFNYTDYEGEFDYDGNATEAGETISEGSGESQSTTEEIERKSFITLFSLRSILSCF